MFSSKHALKLCLLLCILIAPLLACNISVGNVNNASGTPTTPAGQSGTQFNVWQRVSSGIELRYEDWKSPGDNEDTMTILRFDVSKVHLSVGYQPSNPMTVSDWAQKEHALAVINGGYFDQNNTATALVVSNGQAYGSSYNGFGGMLSVDAQGNISLRALSQQPYDPNNEQLEQATQSSPMLMINGKRTQFQANAASQRRTIIAQDTQGRLLFIISPGQAFSLDEIADLLASSDLSLKTALNLDGGASTGLYMNSGGKHVEVDSVTMLPIVVAVK